MQVWNILLSTFRYTWHCDLLSSPSYPYPTFGTLAIPYFASERLTSWIDGLNETLNK